MKLIRDLSYLISIISFLSIRVSCFSLLHFPSRIQDVVISQVDSNEVPLFHRDISCRAHNPNILSDDGTGFYVHIPYCRRRCRYCDFAIVPIGNMELADKTLKGFQKMDESYRYAVTTEIDLLARSLKNAQTDGKGSVRLSSIYFGGGTPSLAPLETIKSILDHILAADGPFYLEQDAEITIEMDPGTFNEVYLLELKQLGFNRISLGVQSFDDDILQSIGRVHRKKDIYDAIKIIENVYGEENANYSIDLISGLPGLDIESWEATVRTALALKPCPNHFSVYDLQIEEGTVFGRMYSDGHEDDHTNQFPNKIFFSDGPMKREKNMPLPSADECAAMYRAASEILQEHGFEHYEISSYAKIHDRSTDAPGRYRSKHNQIYWRLDGNWYAVGMGATSSTNGKRYARPKLLADYVSWVEKERTKSVNSECSYDWQPESIDRDEESDQERLMETIMTRLRTKEGLDLNWIETRYNGKEILTNVMKGAELGIQLGLAKVEYKDPAVDQDKGSLHLTDPDGFLFSNSIISSIFAELMD